jgi:hypothetical protein
LRTVSKKAQVESIDEAFKDSGIETLSFWYTQAEHKHPHFTPGIAAVQFEAILNVQEIFDDEEIKKLTYSFQIQYSAERFLNELSLETLKEVLLYE